MGRGARNDVGPPVPTASTPDGMAHYAGFLDAPAAAALAAEVFAGVPQWLSPRTPRGQPFSVQQYNFGPLGWLSGAEGYHYAPVDPRTGAPWPRMPQAAGDVWRWLLPGAPPPECCLANWYGEGARMGLHRDADEAAMDVPIVSISLGQPARFRLGGPARGGPTSSLILRHGDVLILAGPARGFYHGIDRLLPPELGTPPLPFAGRLNLTLRRVTLP